MDLGGIVKSVTSGLGALDDLPVIGGALDAVTGGLGDSLLDLAGGALDAITSGDLGGLVDTALDAGLDLALNAGATALLGPAGPMALGVLDSLGITDIAKDVVKGAVGSFFDAASGNFDLGGLSDMVNIATGGGGIAGPFGSGGIQDMVGVADQTVGMFTGDDPSFGKLFDAGAAALDLVAPGSGRVLDLAGDLASDVGAGRLGEAGSKILEGFGNVGDIAKGLGLDPQLAEELGQLGELLSGLFREAGDVVDQGTKVLDKGGDIAAQLAERMEEALPELARRIGGPMTLDPELVKTGINIAARLGADLVDRGVELGQAVDRAAGQFVDVARSMVPDVDVNVDIKIGLPDVVNQVKDLLATGLDGTADQLHDLVSTIADGVRGLDLAGQHGVSLRL